MTLQILLLFALIALIVLIIVAGYVKAPPDRAYIISGMRKVPRILIGRAEEAEKARKEAEERAKAEQEAQATAPTACQPAEPVPVWEEEQKEQPAASWVNFSALLTTDQALMLKEFFESNGIQFKAI